MADTYHLAAVSSCTAEANEDPLAQRAYRIGHVGVPGPKAEGDHGHPQFDPPVTPLTLNRAAFKCQ